VDNRPPFPFEKSQAVPKVDDFSLSRGVHDGHSGAKPNVNEKRTIFKPLGLGPWRWVPTRHPKSNELRVCRRTALLQEKRR
jgi:hypothetical protein